MIKMVKPTTFKNIGSDLNPSLCLRSSVFKWFQPFIIATQSSSPSPYYFVGQADARNEIH